MNPEALQTIDVRAILAILDQERMLTERPRQVRLFCHACCTRLLPKHPPPVYLRALEIMLESADGKSDFFDVNRVGQEVMRVEDDLTRIMAFAQAIQLCLADDDPFHFDGMSELIGNALEMRGEQESEPLCNIIRDIFGGQYLREPIDPRWQTSTVLDLARTIDSEQCYERMPILADALIDAGCDSETLINHCQGPDPHVRGCWVVDLLMGRK